MSGRRVMVVIEPGPGADQLLGLIAELDVVPEVVSSAGAVQRADDDWDAVVIDAALAADGGFRVIGTLRGRLGQAVPIVLLTALGDLDVRKKGIENGADDFLVAPPAPLEVRVRLEQVLRLRSLARELETAREQLALSSLGDPSTGLYSPRAMTDRLAAEYARARRYKRPLGVLVAAVGRAGRGAELAGEHLLSAVGQGVRAALRQTDFLARSGLSELAIIAPETSIADCHALSTRLTAQLGRLGLAARVSFGCASSEDHLVATPDDLVARAREAGASQR